SAPLEAVQLVCGPVDCLVDRFAGLSTLRDHLRHRRLRIDLVRDVGRCRRSRDRLDDLTPRRVIPDAPLGRSFPGPGFELTQATEARAVVAVAAGDQLLDRLLFPEMQRQALRGRLVRRELPDPPE